MPTTSSTRSGSWWEKVRTHLGLFWGGTLLALLAIVVASPKLASVQDPSLPPGEGIDVVTGLCSICHGLDLVTQQRQDRDGWTRLVDQMIQFGAPIPPVERQVIIEYLATHFGPSHPLPGGRRNGH